MQTKTVQGRDVRFWSFDTDANGNVKGFVKNPVDVQISIPESLDEALAVANQDQARLIELVVKGLESEAEEKAGSTPAGTFSTAMVAALDKSMKLNPLFSAIKSSKERREAIMRWIGNQPGMKEVMLTAYEGVRNAKSTEDDEG